MIQIDFTINDKSIYRHDVNKKLPVRFRSGSDREISVHTLMLHSLCHCLLQAFHKLVG